MPKLTSQIHVKREYANQEVTFPVIGNAKFDSDATLEVPEDKLEAFIEATKDAFDFAVVGQQKEQTEDEKDIEEHKELLKLAKGNELLLLVKETGNQELINAAAAMSDAKIRNRLLDLYKEEKKNKK